MAAPKSGDQTVDCFQETLLRPFFSLFFFWAPLWHIFQQRRSSLSICCCKTLLNLLYTQTRRNFMHLHLHGSWIPSNSRFKWITSGSGSGSELCWPPTPSPPFFFKPPQLALVSFRVVQIWYWSLDIRHTVRELADTQRHSVPVLSLLQIPLHVVSLPGSSCNRSSNWSHLRWRQIHTVVSFQLYPSAFTSSRNISIPLAKSFSLATHLVYSATSNLISLSLLFFCIIVTAMWCAKCLFELDGIFTGGFALIDRPCPLPGWRYLILRPLTTLSMTLEKKSLNRFVFSLVWKNKHCFGFRFDSNVLVFNEERTQC